MTLILSGTNGLSDVDGSAATPAIRGTDTNTGIFFPAADTVGIATGGSERLRLDSSGNLGLGVTPSAWATSYKAFQIGSVGRSLAQTGAGAGDLTLAFNAIYSSANSRWDYAYTGDSAVRYSQNGSGVHAWFTAASGTAGNAITFTQAMTLDASGNLLVGTTSPTYSSSGRGLVEINGSSNSLLALKTGGSAAGYLYHDGTALSLVNTKASYIQFTTNSIDAARIDSSGKFMVGTTTASGRVTIKPASNAYSEGLNLIASNSSNYWSQLVSTDNNLYFGYNGADKGYFNNSTGAYTTSSDERLKKNITNIQYGLNEVIALRPVAYNMNEQTDGETKALGFIAQEAMQVIPESVTEMMSGMYGMDKVALVPVLVKAIQEQQAIITQLQADVAALKGQA